MATQRGPDGSVRLAVSGTVTNIPWACIGWVQTGNSSTMSQVDLDNLLGDWSTAFQTRFGPHMSTPVLFTSAAATGFYGQIHALHSTKTLTGAGTATGTQIGDQSACLVVSWNTSVYWRGGKPRTYIPVPPMSAMMDGTKISAAEDAALTASAQGFHNDVQGFAIAGMLPITHGFVSFRSGNAPRVPPLFFPILGAQVHPRLGSQRRRLGAWIP